MEVEGRVEFHSLDAGRTSLLLALRQGLNCRSNVGNRLFDQPDERKPVPVAILSRFPSSLKPRSSVIGHMPDRNAE